jgi:hypothetical protein
MTFNHFFAAAAIVAFALVALNLVERSSNLGRPSEPVTTGALPSHQIETPMSARPDKPRYEWVAPLLMEDDDQVLPSPLPRQAPLLRQIKSPTIS